MQIPQQNIMDAIINMVSVQGDTEFLVLNNKITCWPQRQQNTIESQHLGIMKSKGMLANGIFIVHFREQGVREASVMERNAQEGTRILGLLMSPSITGLISSASLLHR